MLEISFLRTTTTIPWPTLTTLFEDFPVHLDLENIDGEGDHLFEDDPEVEKILEKFKGKQRKKKQGRRPSWSATLEQDLVDIIASNHLYKQKLIYENMRKVPNTRMYEEIAKELGKRAEERQEKFEFDVTQIRNKFKTLTAECKKVSLTIKTATGITRGLDHGLTSSTLLSRLGTVAIPKMAGILRVKKP